MIRRIRIIDRKIFALLPLVDTVDIEFDTLEKDESIAWNYYLIPLMYK